MIIGLLISILYTIFVLACFIGILLPRCQHKEIKPPKSVSIIISAYNEESRILQLLESLKTQTYQNFNTYIINDGSTDNTLSIINEFAKNSHSISIFTTNHIGKDTAIKTLLNGEMGIEIDGLILITDADCTLPPTWIESILNNYQDTGASMLIGPVRIDPGHPIQATEFLSIQGITIGSANIGHPLMCGGANLAFTAESYKRVSLHMTNNINGTDMFLLEAMKKSKEPIVAVNDIKAQVTTAGTDSLEQFLIQRSRWAGKGSKYTDLEVMAAGLVTIAMQLLLIASLILAINQPIYLIFWLAKLIIDLPLLLAVIIKYKQQKLIPYILPVFIAYPFYVLITLTKSLTSK